MICAYEATALLTGYCKFCKIYFLLLSSILHGPCSFMSLRDVLAVSKTGREVLKNIMIMRLKRKAANGKTRKRIELAERISVKHTIS